MAALTASRVTPHVNEPGDPQTNPYAGSDDRRFYPVAAGATIFQGSIVVLNSSGFAQAATTATTITCVGIAQADAVNTGLDGAVKILVRSGGFSVAQDGTITAAGSLCFVTDDQTVSGTATGRSVAGQVIRFVSASEVWVDFQPTLSIAPVSGTVPVARTISTTAPLAGGGDLSANRTFTIGTFPAANPLKVNNAGDTHKTTITSGSVGADLTLVTPATSGTIALAAVASAGTAPAFTGTASVAAEVQAFTGTGYATVGQVVTTTDTQTMTLNQCAGMWLITATKAPCLIVSNTAVTGAVAVLTVYGAAPATTNEGYQILKSPTPAGTVASHTHVQS